MPPMASKKKQGIQQHGQRNRNPKATQGKEKKVHRNKKKSHGCKYHMQGEGMEWWGM